jgi:hypothetical protein
MNSASQIVEKAQKEARSEQEAVTVSREIGYPCVLKVSSQDISRKSTISG